MFTALACVPIAAGAAMFALNGQGAEAVSQGAPASFHYVTVTPGESLWQIAQQVAPNTDPRTTIAAIADLNQLPDATIDPGQRLAIPHGLH